MRTFFTWLLTLATMLALVAPTAAQERIGGPTGGKRIGGPLAGLEGDANLDDPITVSAQFTAATTGRPAVLMITAQIAPGYHVYSVTQPPGGPTRTKIEVAPSPQYKLVGQYRATPEPKSHIDQHDWVGLTLEEHENEVTWYAPIEIAAGVDPAKLEVGGTVRMLACKESCVPVNLPFQAKLGKGVSIGPLDMSAPANQSSTTNPASQPNPPHAANLSVAAANSQVAASVGTFQADGSEVRIDGRIEPAIVRPGDTANVNITATPSAGWHIYAWAPRDEGGGSKPTLLAVETTGGLIAGQPTTTAVVKTDDSVPQFGVMRYYEGSATWTVPVKVPAEAKPGQYSLGGLVGYQACESRDDHLGSCELPKGAFFNGTLQIGDTAGSAPAPLSFFPAAYNAVAKSASSAATQITSQTSPDSQPLPASGPAYDLDRIVVQQAGTSLAYYVLLAFVGGIILNLMPCVLPVIGLKVMSFVQQAGKSRGHALVLNLWYSAGIVAVFLLLGVLAATIGFSWGAQFGSTAFNATLAAIVFAMALSLLGVWEIPIPGFFGGGAAQELAMQEGPLGAFLKGVITTVLATPCTGPFMATAIAWAINQSFATTLTVFASLGLGMASPYLVVGVFPELLRFIPKPGAWMETFKQLMGFVLLATVVFILSFMDPASVVPTVALLLGVGVACWLISRTPLTAALTDKLQGWALASAVVLLAAVVAFGVIHTDADSIQWEPFSLAKLQRIAVDEHRTVLVDFSAEWCLTCKALERTVLHTRQVEQAIVASGAVPMYADYTKQPPEIERTIRALRSNGVPVIAVFPGDRPYEPIVFRDGYTKSGLIAALKQATGRNLDAKASMAETAAANPPLH